jgi:outer membrane protein assembly factor BamB
MVRRTHYDRRLVGRRGARGQTNAVHGSPRRSRVLTVVLLALAALLSSCNWPEFRFGPAGTGFNPFEFTIGASNVSRLQQHWSEPFNFVSTSDPDDVFHLVSSPVVAYGIVYGISSGGGLYAFDATTGSGDWSYQMGASAYATPPPAIDKGVIYVASDNTLFAFEALTGAKLWTSSVGVPDGSSPVVNDGVVFVGTLNGLVAISATTGSLLWSNNLGGNQPPVVANGIVYSPAFDGLHAFSATTGSSLWAVSAPPVRSYSFDSAPVAAVVAVANGVVYLAADKLHAFNAKTGAQLWSADTVTNGFDYSSLAVANGVVYETSYPGLNAYSASTGARLWSTPSQHYGFGPSPAVANGVVYVGAADGRIHAFDASKGTDLSSFPSTGGGSVPSAVIANGVAFVGGADLYAYGLSVPRASLTVSPTFTPDYGTVLDGTSSAPTKFTVTNFGSTATTPITDTLTGHDASQFRVRSDTCNGAALSGGASCTVEVAFAPTLPGVLSTTLKVNAAQGGALAATLSGTGNVLSISPTAKDYGSVFVGTRSPPSTFTVTNHSSTKVSTTVTPLAGSEFTATADTCSGATLAPGGTCSVAVAFTPTGVGYSSSAYLSVSSVPGNTVSASLTGTERVVAIAPPTKDYGTVPVGSSTSSTFTITNGSTAALTDVFASVNPAQPPWSIADGLQWVDPRQRCKLHGRGHLCTQRPWCLSR